MNNLVFVFCQKAPLPVPAKSSSLFAKLCKFPFPQLTKSEKRLTNSVFVSRLILISVFTPPFSFSRYLRLLNTFPSVWLFQHSTFNIQLSTIPQTSQPFTGCHPCHRLERTVERCLVGESGLQSYRRELLALTLEHLLFRIVHTVAVHELRKRAPQFRSDAAGHIAAVRT